MFPEATSLLQVDCGSPYLLDIDVKGIGIKALRCEGLFKIANEREKILITFCVLHQALAQNW